MRLFRFLNLLLGWLVVGSSVGSAASMVRDEAAVHRAHEIFGDESWSQVVRIENDAPNSRYPRVTWALVFELKDRLWIYLPREGTQSFSVTRGLMATDKSDLGPLLRRIHDGFHGYREIEPNELRTGRWTSEHGRKPPPLPNGCLVESVVKLRELVRDRVWIIRAQLLFIYAKRGATQWGHTVLCFATPEGEFVWDPASPTRYAKVVSSASEGALGLARGLVSAAVVPQLTQARLLDIDPGLATTTRIAFRERVDHIGAMP